MTAFNQSTTTGVLGVLSLHCWRRMRGALVLLCLTAAFLARPVLSSTDIQIVGFSAENLSPDNEEIIETGLVKAFLTSLSVGGPAPLGTDSVVLTNELRWFQGIRVDQPAGPNAGLVYRHTLGHSMTFTVLDPSFEGYNIYIEQSMHGRISVSQEDNPPVEARLQPMVARIDIGDGNGLQVYPDPSTGSEVVRVDAETPPALAQVVVDTGESFLVPGDFAGDRTFTIQFNSSPSTALATVLGNFGAGEGTYQFGIASPLAQFQYADFFTPKTLGHAVVVRIESKNPIEGDTDGDGVNDDIDNCPLTPNPLQEDTNGNGIGDLCEAPNGC